MQTISKTTRLLLMLLLCMLLIISIIFTLALDTVSANTTTPSLAEQYTDDDYFYYHNNMYSIMDYKDSINSNNSVLFGSSSQYSTNRSVCTITSDDPIVSIIPKQYFITENTTTYIGKEYGFFVTTTLEKKFTTDSHPVSDNYRSTALVFDITNNTNLVTNNDKVIISVTNLMELEFITIATGEEVFYRKDVASDTTYNIETSVVNGSNMDYVVVPLINGRNSAESSKYYLKDISFAGSLHNEQNENQIDATYNPYNDIGSYFTRLDYIYDGIQVIDRSLLSADWSNVGSTFLSESITTAIGFIPVIGDVFSISSAMFTLSNSIEEATSDQWFDSSNDTFVMKSNYTNRDDQIKYNGNLSKSAAIAVNSQSNLTLLFAKADSARTEYTVSHSALNGQKSEYTRFCSEIALKIVDEDFNELGVAKGSQNLYLRESDYKDLEISNSNMIWLLDNGFNYFSFTPSYSGNYLFNITSSDNVKITIDGQAYQGTNISAKIKLLQHNNYHITVENLSQSRIATTLSVDVDTNRNNLQLASNERQVIKLDDTQGFFKLMFDSDNATLTILDSNFEIVKNNGSNVAYYSFIRPVYYVVIENNNTAAITGNLIISNENTSICVGDSNICNIVKGDSFFKFSAVNNNTYSFIVFNDTQSSFLFEMYANNGNAVESTVYYGSTYTKYDYNLIANQVYYVGYSNADSTSGTITISVCKSDNVYQFYIDNQLVSDVATLKQNQQFDLKVRVNDVELSDVEYIVGSVNHISKNTNGNYRVLTNAPVSQSNLCKISVIDTNSNSLKSVSLAIIPEFTINLETYSTTLATANKIKWTFTSTSSNYSISFSLKLCYNNGVVRYVNISGSGTGTVDIPVNNQPDVNFAVANAQITNLTFTQYWSSQASQEQYTIGFYNTYHTATGNQLDYPFYLAPFVLNMLFAGGEGSITNPYQIKNSYQLNNMHHMTVNGIGEYASEKLILGHYVLMNNITTSLVALPALSGSFSGLNGQKQITISSLTASGDYAGLFTKIIQGRVEDIKVNISNDNSNSKYKGAICGYITSGRIINCYASGNLAYNSNSSLTTAMGGIVGYVSSGTVTQSTSQVNISTYGVAGGIAGVQYGGSINQSTYRGRINLYYSPKSVKADGDNVAIGGIVGRMYGGSIVNNTISGISINYMGEKCTERDLKPCIGYFVGHKVSNISNITGCSVSNSNTINHGTLHEYKGFLGIGKYNQLEYVKESDDTICGRR